MFREFFNLSINLSKALPFFDASEFSNLFFYRSFPLLVGDKKWFYQVPKRDPLKRVFPCNFSHFFM